MDYLTVQKAADKWGKSVRWVQTLCADNRIEGAMRFGFVWMIPKDADKPIDPRKKRKEQVGDQHGM